MAFSMLVIEPLRIKNYMGPKPNANDHIVIGSVNNGYLNSMYEA
jgi:hypothetical protein